MPMEPLQLRAELQHRVLARTGWQVRSLDIGLHPDKVVLRGEALTYYVKQLAQQGVREFLPSIHLVNAIQVTG